MGDQPFIIMSAYRAPIAPYYAGAYGHPAAAGYGYGYSVEQMNKIREAEQKQYEEYVAAQKKAYEEAAAKEKEYFEKERALAEKLGAYHGVHPGTYGAYGAYGYGY